MRMRDGLILSQSRIFRRCFVPTGMVQIYPDKSLPKKNYPEIYPDNSFFLVCSSTRELSNLSKIYPDNSFFLVCWLWGELSNLSKFSG